MLTIWKFELNTVDIQEVEIPEYADILTIDTQKGAPCLWATVDPNNQLEKRTFEIVGTGNPMQEKFKRKYIGTYQLYEGSLVFHVFEIIKL